MSNIKIIGAIFGAKGESGKALDVTDKIQEKIDEGHTRIQIRIEDLGDPYKGQTKAFGAIYEKDGKVHAVAGKEKETIAF